MMEEIFNFINNIDDDNKETYLEFFFKLLQEIEREIFIETHYTNVGDFFIDFKREDSTLKISILKKELYNNNLSECLEIEQVNFIISCYDNDCIQFEVALHMIRSDLKDYYLSCCQKSNIIEVSEYRILLNCQRDKNSIILNEYAIALNNFCDFEIKIIKIQQKEEKIIVDVLYINAEENLFLNDTITTLKYFWLSDTLKELNLDENLLVFDREEFKNIRMNGLSDFLDIRHLFLIEAKYI